jgi:hypothetical protein
MDVAIPWRSLERWSPRLYLLAGAVLALVAGLVVRAGLDDRQRGHDVGPGEQADERLVLEDGEATDVVALQFGERGHHVVVGRDGHQLRRHDVADAVGVTLDLVDGPGALEVIPVTLQGSVPIQEWETTQNVLVFADGLTDEIPLSDQGRLVLPWSVTKRGARWFLTDRQCSPCDSDGVPSKVIEGK